MITSKNNYIYLERDFILKNKYLCFEFILEDNKATLISGTLLSPCNEPIGNACIEIYEESFEENETFIGRTFTTSDGSYGFTLNINENSTYLFYVYSPL